MFSALACLITSPPESCEIIAQRFAIHIPRIVFDHRDYGVSRNETSKVVDVAMCVIAKDAASQPNHMRRAQVICKHFFVIFSRHARIALLHLAEQAFFRSKQRAQTIHIDRSALEHNAFATMVGEHEFNACGCSHQRADCVVVPPVGIFGPCIEAKLGSAKRVPRFL